MRKHSPEPISVPIETDALRSDVAYAFASATECARELETTARTVFDGLLDARANEPGDELRERAARVRCSARHAATIALELEAMAGRLDGFGLTRQLIEQALESLNDPPAKSLSLSRTPRGR